MYKSLGYSHTRARQNWKAMNTATSFGHFFLLWHVLLVSLLQLQTLLAGLECTISTSLMGNDFDCLLGPVTVSLLSPFLFTQLEISTAGTFSHVYLCTQHINTDQYRFYALNYFDFTLLSSAKMRISKIESMTENYPEFPVANLN